jgi:hypothetical protein
LLCSLSVGRNQPWQLAVMMLPAVLGQLAVPTVEAVL